MPQRQKINLEKVMASLNTVCPKRGCSITPDKIRRIDSRRVVCPGVRGAFHSQKTVGEYEEGKHVHWAETGQMYGRICIWLR